MVSHPEPDILEHEVKWALGSTAVNKASGCDGIPELFKTLKMMPSRCCIQYVSKLGRSSSDHRTGKGQSSSQFPRRVVLKTVLTIRQLHSSPMLVRLCSKSSKLQHYVNQELPDVQAGFRKGRGTRDQIASIHWITENAWEFQKIIVLCFNFWAPKSLQMVIAAMK